MTPPPRASAPRMPQAIGEQFVLDAEHGESFGHDRQPVALLDPQFRGAAHHASRPRAQAAAMKRIGNSSIASGTSAGGTVMPCRALRAHLDVGDGLAVVSGRRRALADADIGPHQLQDLAAARCGSD